MTAVAISVASPKSARRPAALNIPTPEAGPLALLRQLGLGQSDLAAHQLRDLLGQLVHQGAERLRPSCGSLDRS